MSDDWSDFTGPALRGFQLQILCTLARLIEPNAILLATLWREGIEDLAVFDDQESIKGPVDERCRLSFSIHYRSPQRLAQAPNR